MQGIDHDWNSLHHRPGVSSISFLMNFLFLLMGIHVLFSFDVFRLFNVENSIFIYLFAIVVFMQIIKQQKPMPVPNISTHAYAKNSDEFL